MIPLFDLHCDTLGEMYNGNCSLDSSPLHISLDKCADYLPYFQVMAIWSDFRLTPKEAYKRYNEALTYAENQGISFIKDFKSITDRGFILAIEDAKIIEGDLERLVKFKNDGVKIITLFWKDTNLLGGAWNTDIPLSDFGIEFTKKCFELSIIPDISHASIKSTRDIIRIAKESGKTIIASHSNSYTVCNHKRNLTDHDFLEIKNLKGLVGISLACQHLGNDDQAHISDILKHIYHYLSLGGTDTVCLGCDFDGVSTLPHGIRNISDLKELYFEMQYNFGSDITEKIFYKNAFDFFKRNY